MKWHSKAATVHTAEGGEGRVYTITRAADGWRVAVSSMFGPGRPTVPFKPFASDSAARTACEDYESRFVGQSRTFVEAHS